MKTREFTDVVINSRMFIYTGWLCYHNESSVNGHGLFKNSVKYQQDRQYTRTQSVTMRRVYVTFVSVEKQQV